MRVLGLVVALLSSVVFAQGNTGQSTTGISRGNGLRIPQYKTTGTQTWFLDPAGSDANDCRSASTPCLTILGLQGKMPKVIRNPVTITMANGNYTGGWFSGFDFDPADAATGAYILLQGTLTTFTPATGSATGTATSAAACATGPPLTDASLTDTGATWTVNDFRGQLLEITGGTGSGQIIPIDSNTATSITIAGCWAPTPNATSTYAIRTWGAVITTAINQPPNFVSSAGSAIGLGFFDSVDNVRNNNSAFFFTDQIRVSVSTSAGALVLNDTNIYARRSRFDATGVGPGVLMNGSSRLNFQQSLATSTGGLALTQSSFAGEQASRIINGYFQTDVATATNGGMYFVGHGMFIQSSFLRMTNSAAGFGILANEWTAAPNLQGMRIICTAGGTTIGIRADSASNSTPVIPAGPHGLMFDSGAIRECATSIALSGRNVQMTLDDSTFQATAGTVAVLMTNGATLNLDANTATDGTFTNALTFDTNNYTFAAARTAAPILSLTTGGSVNSIP